jgi:hypothetical protein
MNGEGGDDNGSSDGDNNVDEEVITYHQTLRSTTVL